MGRGIHYFRSPDYGKSCSRRSMSLMSWLMRNIVVVRSRSDMMETYCEFGIDLAHGTDRVCGSIEKQ